MNMPTELPYGGIDHLYQARHLIYKAREVLREKGCFTDKELDAYQLLEKAAKMLGAPTAPK